MTIKKAKEGSSLIVTVEGRLDTTTSPELSKELDNFLDNINKLIFDFSKLEYISSSGLRVLLSAQKAMRSRGSMTVKNVPEMIMEIFEITGFTDILTIE